MSEKIKDGGLAFPAEGPCQGQFENPGMTLRDYFAAKALPALCADYCQSAQVVGFDEGWMMGIAMDAYAMADAMIAAREAK